jgi:hypothetical protein
MGWSDLGSYDELMARRHCYDYGLRAERRRERSDQDKTVGSILEWEEVNAKLEGKVAIDSTKASMVIVAEEPKHRTNTGSSVPKLLPADLIGRLLGGEVGEEALSNLQREYQELLAKAAGDQRAQRQTRLRYIELLAANLPQVLWDRIKNIGSRAFSLKKRSDD